MTPAAAYLQQLAPSGRRSVCQRFRWAASQLGRNWPDWIPTPAEVEQIRAQMLAQKMAPATSRLTIAALRGVAKAAHQRGQMTRDDLERIRSVEPVTGRRQLAGRLLEVWEVQAVLQSLDDTAHGRRDGAIFGLCFFAGLRRSEATGLQFAEAVRGRFFSVVGKGNQERKIAIGETLAELLQRYTEHRGRRPGPMLLPVNNQTRQLDASTIRKRCLVMAERAELQPFSPHDLRRSFISHMLDAGIDLATAQKMAGHSSPVTTAGYDRRPERAAVAAAVKLCAFIGAQTRAQDQMT